MALAVEILHQGVVGVLVADEKGASDGAAIRVGAVILEDCVIGVEVQVVNSPVEGDEYHLRNLQDKTKLTKCSNVCVGGK